MPGYPKKFTGNHCITSPTTMVGVAKELHVASELSRQGYEIFMAIGTVSGIDMIAIRGDILEKVEVKSCVELKNGKLAHGTLKNNRPTLVALVTNDYKIYWLPR